MEQYEYHRELLDLPPHAFPITMVCFGYPTQAARQRELTPRFDRACIHFKNGYRRLRREELLQMLEPRKRKGFVQGAANVGQDVYLRKFSASFAQEMTRSARHAISTWTASLGTDSVDPVV